MKHLSWILDHTKAELLRRYTGAENVAMMAWPLVCGARVADRATAIAFDRGVLTVLSNKEWTGELERLEPEYCARLNKILKIPVKRITFLVAKESDSK